MRKRSDILLNIKDNSIDEFLMLKLIKEWFKNMFYYSLITKSSKGKKYFDKEIIKKYQKYLNKTIERETRIIWKI